MSCSKLKRLPILLSVICLILQGCAYFRSNSDQPNWAAFDQKQIKRDIQPLELEIPYEPTESIQQYFDFYGLNPTGAEHSFGTLESEGELLVVHLYLPPNPRGSIFLIHGYFDHSGTLSRLIHESIRQGYAVAVWDLPGHGLSSGIRTDTGEFHLCARQLDDIVVRASNVLPEPFFLIAHSTGASITMEYMRNTDACAFEKIVFLAPLVRHAHWTWGKFGYSIAQPFTKTIRRRAKNNSSDEAYLAFVKNDPLHSNTLSLEYLHDLYEWEKTTRSYPVWPGPVCIIQGDRDKIVDWKYNLKFLQQKIGQPTIHLLSGARHQLANESESMRYEVFQHIFEFLNEKNSTP